MTFKEFGVWCNERACDGFWSMDGAIFCTDLYRTIIKASRFKRKREKMWEQSEYRGIAKKVVDEINEMIAKMDGESNEID